MVMVCIEHLTKGLELLPVPHVKKMPVQTKKTCSFCGKQAELKLFLLLSVREEISFNLIHL